MQSLKVENCTVSNSPIFFGVTLEVVEVGTDFWQAELSVEPVPYKRFESRLSLRTRVRYL